MNGTTSKITQIKYGKWNKLNHQSHISSRTGRYLDAKYYKFSSSGKTREFISTRLPLASDCYSSIILFVDGEYFQPSGNRNYRNIRCSVRRMRFKIKR